MVIYIAHASPRHNDQAARAKSALATPSKETTVFGSMDFDERGKARKEKILLDATGTEQENPYPDRNTCFQDSAVMVVLVPPPKDSLGVQLGEYVEIWRHKQDPPRIYCLHHPKVEVGEITKLCGPELMTDVPGEVSAVRDFILKIYPNERNGVLLEPLTTLLLSAVEAQVPTERHTTAPTFTLTIVEGDLAKLSDGQIPLDAVVGGDGWEGMFGIEPAQAGLKWKDVRDKLADPDQWEPILAEELDTVRSRHWQQNAVPILLEEKMNVPPAAAVVQKHEVYPGNSPDRIPNTPSKLPSVHRFSLVTFRAPMLFDPGDMRPLATAYHLLVTAQLFRFMVVERDLDELKNLKKLLMHRDRIPDAARNAALAIAALRRHLLLIDVECRRRNFLNRLAAFDQLIPQSLRGDRDKAAEAAAEERQKRLSDIFNVKWGPVRAQLDSAISAGERGLSDILARLEELKTLNCEVLVITADAYAGLAANEYAAADRELAAV